jgi:hypothetical protein
MLTNFVAATEFYITTKKKYKNSIGMVFAYCPKTNIAKLH